MDNGLSTGDISSINRILKDYPEVEVGLLYGSRAMGTYKHGSDVDLALKGKRLNSSICSQIHHDLEEESLLPYFFDVTEYATIDNEKLKAHIDRIGVVIYRA